MGRYAFYWGCTIPARFPFMEKATRRVLDALGVEYVDLPGFTCCPEKTLAKNMDEALWRATAARNVAVAERAGVGLTMSCTGCYSVLKNVQSELKAYSRRRKEVNDVLHPLGLEFTGSQPVTHLVELLFKEVGPGRIKALVTRPLTGKKIAVHVGCHMVRPSKGIHFDDPMKPKAYDKIIEWLGAESIEYSTKMFCCGGSLDRVDQHGEALAMARVKLDEVKALCADAISTTCPECFKVYDNNQFFIQKENGVEYNIPVLTLQELMGLAFGMSPEDLGMDGHRIDTAKFMESL